MVYIKVIVEIKLMEMIMKKERMGWGDLWNIVK